MCGPSVLKGRVTRPPGRPRPWRDPDEHARQPGLVAALQALGGALSVIAFVVHDAACLLLLQLGSAILVTSVEPARLLPNCPFTALTPRT